MKKIFISFAMSLVAAGAFAQTNYKILRACNPEDVKHYYTEQLRSNFMMPKVMAVDTVNMTYSMYDRLIFGGVVPVERV
ncbi:MAG: 5-dehydro-4-deoxy-D-glucuronate isomerase, partial [Muribaculaceae bacterium]|nr:5-dehydro-4-deoxy-D-glucuronate isomerase [Muribaculaceae bacterium]